MTSRNRGKNVQTVHKVVNPEIHRRAKSVLNGARDRARKKGVVCTLVLNDVYEVLLNSDRCPILGVSMTWHNGENYDPYARTLDRINPKLGYVTGNIWIVSMRGNQIKSDASLPELIRAMANLINHLYTGESDEGTGTGHRDEQETQYNLDLRN